MTIIVSDNVRACVARGNEFPLGRPFTLMDGCIKYNCDCHSDGSWECPADRAEDTCQPDRSRQPTTDGDHTRTRSECICDEKNILLLRNFKKIIIFTMLILFSRIS